VGAFSPSTVAAGDEPTAPWPRYPLRSIALSLMYSILPYALHIASAASDMRLIVDRKAAKADVGQVWPCNSRKYGWYGHSSCHADWYGLSTRCTPIVLD